jgi:hypothetical protein
MLGRVWVYDLVRDRHCRSFTPVSAANTWEQALRTAGALASSARTDQQTAASEFWDREASLLLAPLLHAAAITNQPIPTVLDWISREFLNSPKDTSTPKASTPSPRNSPVCSRATSATARPPS